MRKLERIVHCDDTLELCRRIIDSFNDTEAPVLVFAGDDLFTGASRLRGLPIGNLTSQLWGNFYLDEMDHLIKERLGAVGYARYTDDWQAQFRGVDSFSNRLATFLRVWQRDGAGNRGVV